MSMKLKKVPWIPDEGSSLNKNELEAAFKDLNINKYRKLERGFQDPSIQNQNVALFSFVPCEQPNKYNLFGFAKIRGVFSTQFEADEHARKIIKKFDSVNEIHHCKVGQPFPIGLNFHGEYDNVVMEEEMEIAEKSLKLKQNEKYESECQELETRKKQLFDDVDPTIPKSNVDLYITKRHKFAATAVLYEEYTNLVERMKGILIKTNIELKELENEEILNSFQQEYNRKIKEVGLEKDISEDAIKVKKYFEMLPKYDFIN